MNHYFIKIDYQPEFGISGEELMNRVKENRIPSNALVRKVDSEHWKPLNRYPEFLYLQPPPLPPKPEYKTPEIIEQNIENNEKTIPKYFLPVGRINGSIWFFRNIINFVIFIFISSLFNYAPDELKIVWLFPLLIYIYIIIINASKRLHDWNITGWFAPIVFIPFVALFFWLIPGNKNSNRFGEKLNGVWRYLFSA
jgi:uncharacterized membrane protein YhaH (DUF805 family)